MGEVMRDNAKFYPASNGANVETFVPSVTKMNPKVPLESDSNKDESESISEGERSGDEEELDERLLSSSSSHEEEDEYEPYQDELEDDGEGTSSPSTVSDSEDQWESRNNNSRSNILIICRFVFLLSIFRGG